MIATVEAVGVTKRGEQRTRGALQPRHRTPRMDRPPPADTVEASTDQIGETCAGLPGDGANAEPGMGTPPRSPVIDRGHDRNDGGVMTHRLLAGDQA